MRKLENTRPDEITPGPGLPCIPHIHPQSASSIVNCRRRSRTVLEESRAGGGVMRALCVLRVAAIVEPALGRSWASCALPTETLKLMAMVQVQKDKVTSSLPLTRRPREEPGQGRKSPLPCRRKKAIHFVVPSPQPCQSEADRPGLYQTGSVGVNVAAWAICIFSRGKKLVLMIGGM